MGIQIIHLDVTLHLEMSENIGWGYVGGTSNGFYSKYVKNIISPFKYVPRP